VPLASLVDIPIRLLPKSTPTARMLCRKHLRDSRARKLERGINS
jgi:hypothetical protein